MVTTSASSFSWASSRAHELASREMSPSKPTAYGLRANRPARAQRIAVAGIIVMLASIALFHGAVLLVIVAAAAAMILVAVVADTRLSAVRPIVIGIAAAVVVILILSSI